MCRHGRDETLAEFRRICNVGVLHEYANCIEQELMWPGAHTGRITGKTSGTRRDKAMNQPPPKWYLTDIAL